MATHSAEKQGLSLNQLRLVLATAFQHFDLDGNGQISLQEFYAALRRFDITLSGSEAEALLGFFGVGDGIALHDLKPPVSERFQAAVTGASDRLAETSGWKGAAEMMETLSRFDPFVSPKSLGKRLKDLLRDKTEIFADTAELAATIAGMIAVLHQMQGHSEVHGTEWLEQLQLLSHDFNAAVQSVLESTPVGSMLASAALAAMNAVRRNSDIIGHGDTLNEDEALLYARSFQGWPMSLFRQLLDLGSWGRATGGRSK